MPRKCSICSHPDKDDVDRSLLDRAPYRNIAERFGVSIAALTRHKAEHLPVHLARAQEVTEIAGADELLGQVKILQARTRRILDLAEVTGDLRTALVAIRESRGNLELLAKMLNEVRNETTLDILVAPDWVDLRGVVVRAVEPYPEAKRAVLEALDAGG